MDFIVSFAVLVILLYMINQLHYEYTHIQLFLLSMLLHIRRWPLNRFQIEPNYHFSSPIGIRSPWGISWFRRTASSDPILHFDINFSERQILTEKNWPPQDSNVEPHPRSKSFDDLDRSATVADYVSKSNVCIKSLYQITHFAVTITFVDTPKLYATPKQTDSNQFEQLIKWFVTSFVHSA